MKKRIKKKNIENLLNQQVEVILGAVNEKQQETKKLIQGVEVKVDRVYNKLDKYLEMYSKQDQEFKLMRVELKLVKDVLKEKLGIDIDTLLFK